MNEPMVIMLTSMADGSGVRADWVHLVGIEPDGAARVRLRGGSKQWSVPAAAVDPERFGGERVVLTRAGSAMWERARWQIQARALGRDLSSTASKLMGRGMDIPSRKETVAALRQALEALQEPTPVPRR